MGKKLYMEVVTPVGRVRYATLGIPQSRGSEGDGKPGWGLTLLFDAQTDVSEIRSAILKVIKNDFPDMGKEAAMKLLNERLRDGNVDKSEKPEFRDQKFLAAFKYAAKKTGEKNNPPGIFRKNSPATSEAIYPGCYARAHLTFASYDFNGKKGVSAYLNHVQFDRDGERMSGGEIDGYTAFGISPEAGGKAQPAAAASDEEWA